MCRYNAAVCTPYVGQVVAIHTRSGIHRGRLDRVTSRGVYLTPMVGRPGTVAGEVSNDFLTLEQTAPAADAEHVFWGWGWGWGAPFFIPFLSILALSTLFFW